MADQMRTAGSTAIKRAAPAGVTYKGSAQTTSSLPTVKAPSRKHAINQAKQRLVEDQKVLERELQREQNAETLGLRLKSQVQLAGLQSEQVKTKADLKLEQEYELNSFKLQADTERARASMDVAGTAAKGQVTMARTNVINTVINQIASLSKTFGEAHVENLRLEKEVQDVYHRLFGVSPNGDEHWDQKERVTLLDNERALIRDAAAKAAEKVGGNDPFTKSEILQDVTNGAKQLVQRQISSLEFANNLNAILGDAMADGKNLVEIPGRGVIGPADIETRTELTKFLNTAARKAVLNWMINSGGSIDQETAPLIREKLDKAINYQYQIWAPKIAQRNQETYENVLSEHIKVSMETVTEFGASIPIDLEWRRTANLLRTGPNPMSKAAANKRATELMIGYFKNTRNREGLETLLTIQKVDGQTGTELSSNYGDLIYKAINDLDATQITYEKGLVKQVEGQMFEALFKLPENATAQDREQIIFSNIAQMEQIGGYGHEAAHNWRKKIVELRAPGGIELNELRLSEGIIDGTVTSQLELNQAKALGMIDTSRLKSLSGLLENQQKTKTVQNEQVKTLVNSRFKGFRGKFLEDMGLKKDLSGNAIEPYSNDGKTSVIEGWKADQYTDLIKIEINRLSNELIRQNPELLRPENRGKLMDTLSKNISNFLNENVYSENGAYYVPPKLDSKELLKLIKAGDFSEEAEYNKTRREAVDGIINSPWSISTTYNTTDIQPVDFSTRINDTINGDSGVDSSIALEYNPVRGDKIFDSKLLTEIHSVWQEGGVHPQLEQVAAALKTTPLKLLNQELYSHRRKTVVSAIQPGNIQPGLFSPITEAEVIVADAKAPMDSLSGAKYLMRRHNLPHKGAAWLVGNIEQESSWDGRRYWGEVMNDGTDRNGGLVSWVDDAQREVFRLKDAETYLGKPITEATNAEQLDYMLYEMKNTPYYRSAYETFMNPWATIRQLESASKLYWGFHRDHVGSRYQYAQDTFNELITPPPITE